MNGVVFPHVGVDSGVPLESSLPGYDVPRIHLFIAEPLDTYIVCTLPSLRPSESLVF